MLLLLTLYRLMFAVHASLDVQKKWRENIVDLFSFVVETLGRKCVKCNASWRSDSIVMKTYEKRLPYKFRFWTWIAISIRVTERNFFAVTVLIVCQCSCKEQHLGLRECGACGEEYRMFNPSWLSIFSEMLMHAKNK